MLKLKKMRTFKFEKLVRDKIKDRIEEGGGKVKSRLLSKKEYVLELKRKLLEEAKEFVESEEGSAEELADVQEIVDCLLRELGIGREELEKKKKQKIEKRGGFNRRIYIKEVKVKENDSWLDYYLANPHKYPEIEEGS